MPLRDHFQPPFSQDCPWESMHATWAPAIAGQLNQHDLPANYRARPFLHVGSPVEIDVATSRTSEPEPQATGNGIATAVWAPPQTSLSAVVDFTDRDVFEIQIQQAGGRQLVAAIELVSPGNKDRPGSRRDFVVKCASYLQQGVAVVIVDVVTTRRDNLHRELMHFLEMPVPLIEAAATPLYAVSYRIRLGDDHRHHLALWPAPLDLNADLPTMPLWLAEDLAVPLRLEAGYQIACEMLGIE